MLCPCCAVCESPNLKHGRKEVVQGMTKDFFVCSSTGGGEGGEGGLFEDYVMLCSSLLELKAWCMLYPPRHSAWGYRKHNLRSSNGVDL